jgi:hypothetical protein
MRDTHVAAEVELVHRETFDAQLDFAIAGWCQARQGGTEYR